MRKKRQFNYNGENYVDFENVVEQELSFDNLYQNEPEDPNHDVNEWEEDRYEEQEEEEWEEDQYEEQEEEEWEEDQYEEQEEEEWEEDQYEEQEEEKREEENDEPVRSMKHNASKKISEGLSNNKLGGFIPSSSTANSKEPLEAGVITIINSKKNGKRITLSKELLKHLNKPTSLQFSFSENEIAVGENIPGNNNSFPVKKYGVKGVIYSSSLVQEISETFDMDFTRRVSVTFKDAKYIVCETKKVALIRAR